MISHRFFLQISLSNELNTSIVVEEVYTWDAVMISRNFYLIIGRTLKNKNK